MGAFSSDYGIVSFVTVRLYNTELTSSVISNHSICVKKIRIVKHTLSIMAKNK